MKGVKTGVSKEYRQVRKRSGLHICKVTTSFIQGIQDQLSDLSTKFSMLQYCGEQDMHYVMKLVDNELSEPYSIFTYRYGTLITILQPPEKMCL